MIATNVEIILVGVAIVEDDGFEIIAAWWGKCCVGG